MKIKKSIALFAICTLIGTSIIPMTASAHHNGNRHHNGTGSKTTVCTISDCHKTGKHTHNNTTYKSRCSTYNHEHHN